MSASIDLSSATRLEEIDFRLGWLNIEWIIMALQTITPEHRDLRQITINVSDCSSPLRRDEDHKKRIGEAIRGQWLALDRLLVEFWESRSVRPSLVRKRTTILSRGIRDGCEYLLPELTGRGIVDLTGL